MEGLVSERPSGLIKKAMKRKCFKVENVSWEWISVIDLNHYQIISLEWNNAYFCNMGISEKVDRAYFENRSVLITNIFFSFNISTTSQNTFLFFKITAFVVNWLSGIIYCDIFSVVPYTTNKNSMEQCALKAVNNCLNTII